MTKTQYSLYGFVILAVLAVVYLMGASQRTYQAEASTITGMDYNATSTAASNLFGAQTAGGQIIKSRAGTLASVIITGANTGVVNFYDATTTDISKRTGNTATSSILLASFPTNATVGTYTLDIGFNTSLLMELYSGNMPTTTITWR